MTRPDRPTPLSFDPEPVPEQLREREQWVCWHYEWDGDRDEWTKVPINPNTGGYASSTDATTWTTFDDAVAYHERDEKRTDGVGFVVHDEDLVVGLDLDDCRDPDTDDLEPWAADLLADVPTYTEVSPSGTGARLFGFGFVPDGGNRADIDGAEGHLELYDTGRYLTVTGHPLKDGPMDVRQVNEEIQAIHAEYVAPDTDEEGSNPRGNVDESAGATGTVDLEDAELIERAKNAENGEKFTRLWNGRTAGYPSHSEADLALASLVAWWTGGDRQRTDDLFRQSGLMREKWDEDRGAKTYGERTLDKALGSVTDGYDPTATDGGTRSTDTNTGGPQVPSPEELLGTEPAEVTDELEDDENDGDDAGDYDPLSPSALRALAGIDTDEGESIDDLSDREKAALTWELIGDSPAVHVRVRRDNGSLWSYDSGVWKPEGERALRHAARQTLGPVAYGQNVLTELKTQVRADPTAETEADTFGMEPGYLAVENGRLDLEGAAAGAGMDALRDLRPEDYALARLPVTYDPSADYEEWHDLVTEWAEDGRADALQEYAGYCLHAGALPIHRALLLVGSGANGKGTFLAVVRALLGRENTSSIELQTLANERDAVADFYGALANIDDDLSARKLGQGLGMFKKLVAGDRVRARRLYESGFEFDATGKHLYAANEVPDVDVPDDDEAFWRRWLLVEFPNHYPPGDRDPTLRDRLTEPDHLSAVLNWAVDGRARLLEQGHFTNEHFLAHEKRSRWQAWGDSIEKFISECVESDPDAENMTTGEAHRRYAAWCRENGEKPASQQKLTNALKSEDVGYATSVRVNGTVQRGYKALGLSDDVPALEDTPARGGRQSSLDI